jgi:hypothetical protein
MDLSTWDSFLSECHHPRLVPLACMVQHGGIYLWVGRIEVTDDKGKKRNVLAFFGMSFFLFPLLERAFSCSWLLLNLTGTNWGHLEIQKRHRINSQTENGIRCVGHLGGDTQLSLLLFSIILFILLFFFSLSLLFKAFTIL